MIYDIEKQLLESGLLTADQLGYAKKHSEVLGKSLVRTLLQLKTVPDSEMADLLAKVTGHPRVDLGKEFNAAVAAGLLEKATVKECQARLAVPYDLRDDVAWVAMTDPTDVVALDFFRRQLGVKKCRATTATEREVLTALDGASGAKGSISGIIAEIILRTPPEKKEVEEVNLGETEPNIQLVNQIIEQGVKMGASDIHFEPTDSELLVRMRIDGTLNKMHWVPKGAQSMTLTRLKILAMMDVAESRVPQDGRTTLEVDHRRLSLRVSTLPTRHGESIVLRILDANEAVQGLGDLGLDEVLRSDLLEIMDAPHGVVIVTGPTGSGKTTTLYAMLKHLNSPDVSIFTLEDPVEIPVAGIRQTQVNEDVGLTFGKCLRALLRQDPDIILVGETRDQETAELMIRAALTGHLVFTTLHTNDAPGAIPRLIDMGVAPYLLPSSLVAILAQRLVRRLCRNCSQPLPDPRAQLGMIGVPVPEDTVVTLWDAPGCPDCHGAGYKGRQAIFEVMRMQESLHELIIRRSAHSEFRKTARRNGMRTMFEDGLRHAMAGNTSLRELLRVARPDVEGA